jgi:putative sporulation protein YtaF
MHWISILFIAFASNLDNLGIGISFGIRSLKITAVSNVIIASITMAGTYLSMTIGELISRYISRFAANILGASMIIVIGIWTVAGSLRVRSSEQIVQNIKGLTGVIRNPSTADIDHNNVISTKESIALGTALALNNMATGFGAGATGVSPLWTTIVAGLYSLLFIGYGSQIGHTIARTWFGRYSNVTSGIILILIGVYEMIS